ncbi:Transaldolase [subsurface metagenome]
MKIFIDTAKLDEIKEAYSWGIIDGVTTNPTLIKLAVEAEKGKGRNVNMKDYIKEILKTVGKEGAVSLEVISLNSEAMVKEGELLYDKFNPMAENVVIKIPINTYSGDSSVSDFEGIKAIKVLREKDILVNATIIMSPEQALLAAKAGATYASPFAGRIDNYVRNNLGISFKETDYFDHSLVKTIAQEKLQNYLNKSNDEEIASLYTYEDIRKLADIGDNNGIDSGTDLVERIAKIYRIYGFNTEIIASAMRSARQVREMAEAGAHVITMGFQVLKDMFRHPKTTEGIRGFSRDIVPEYKALFE